MGQDGATVGLRCYDRKEEEEGAEGATWLVEETAAFHAQNEETAVHPLTTPEQPHSRYTAPPLPQQSNSSDCSNTPLLSSAILFA